MKNFIRIGDRLFYDKDDASRSGKLKQALLAIEKDLPKVREDRKRVRDGELWDAIETIRKANELNYSAEEKEPLKAKMWAIQNKMDSPLKELNSRHESLTIELQSATVFLRNDLVSVLSKAIEEVARELRVNRLGDSSHWVDTKNGLSVKTVTVRKISQNIDSVEEVKRILLSFKMRVQGMTALSHEEILAEVKAIEDQVNGIDISKMIEVEIDQLQFQNYREMKLL